MLLSGSRSLKKKTTFKSTHGLPMHGLPTLGLDVVIETELVKKTAKNIETALLALMAEQRVNGKKFFGRVCLIFTSHQRIRALKQKHWNENVSTDVLSFPHWEKGDAFVPLHFGDIVVSVPTAKKQAKQHGHDLETELLILVAHGLTHLLGHDHNSKKDWQIFLKMQARILEISACNTGAKS